MQLAFLYTFDWVLGPFVAAQTSWVPGVVTADSANPPARTWAKWPWNHRPCLYVQRTKRPRTVYCYLNKHFASACRELLKTLDRASKGGDEVPLVDFYLSNQDADVSLALVQPFIDSSRVRRVMVEQFSTPLDGLPNSTLANLRPSPIGACRTGHVIAANEW